MDNVNDFDLFLYESMVEHQFKPDFNSTAFVTLAMLDALVLSELAETDFDKKSLNDTTRFYYDKGLPSTEHLKTRLYNNIYYNISSPLYHSNFIDPYIPNSYEVRSIVESSAKAHAINEAELAFNYMNTCFDYVKQQDVVIDAKSYITGVKNSPSKQRLSILNNSVKTGELTGGKHKPKLDLNVHFKDSFRYLHQASRFEAKVYANALAHGLGKDLPYSHKTWHWSHKVKTRHKFMEGQTVPINEPFVVTNERTGEMSFLMFPRDYARDISGANTSNCGCDVSYHNKTNDNNLRGIHAW